MASFQAGGASQEIDARISTLSAVKAEFLLTVAARVPSMYTPNLRGNLVLPSLDAVRRPVGGGFFA